MINKAILEMTKGRWREFCREPSALFFVVCMPIVWMVLLGLAFSSQKQEHFKVGLEHSLLKDSLATNALTQSPHVSAIVDEEATLQRQMAKGEIALYLTKATHGYHLTLDSSNPEALAGARLVKDVLQTAHGRKDPIVIKQAESNTSRRYVDFLIPGLLALSLLTTSLFGTGMTIVVNRRENLLKALPCYPDAIVPLHPFSYFRALSYCTSRGLSCLRSRIFAL